MVESNDSMDGGSDNIGEEGPVGSTMWFSTSSTTNPYSDAFNWFIENSLVIDTFGSYYQVTILPCSPNTLDVHSKNSFF